MKTLKHGGPKYIFDRCKEELYTSKRRPLAENFFNNSRGSIGKQSIEHRQDLMEGLGITWMD